MLHFYFKNYFKQICKLFYCSGPFYIFAIFQSFSFYMDPKNKENKEDMDKIMAAYKKIQLWEFCVENTGMIICLLVILDA